MLAICLLLFKVDAIFSNGWYWEWGIYNMFQSVWSHEEITYALVNNYLWYWNYKIIAKLPVWYKEEYNQVILT